VFELALQSHRGQSHCSADMQSMIDWVPYVIGPFEYEVTETVKKKKPSHLNSIVFAKTNNSKPALGCRLIYLILEIAVT
jgi:hypothetical protein